jgi:hypothetical protein
MLLTRISPYKIYHHKQHQQNQYRPQIDYVIIDIHRS